MFLELSTITYKKNILINEQLKIISMKTKFFITLIGVLFTLSIYSQKGSGTIFFKGGKTLQGTIKIAVGDIVKYKKDKKSKKVKYSFKDIDRIEMYRGSDLDTYVFLKIKDQDNPKVLEEIETGRVNLYRIVTEGTTAGMPMMNGMGGGMVMGMGHSYSLKSYYTLKQGEVEATYLGSTRWFSKNFKKAASEYFNDCPTLVEKIQNREFKKSDIREIVDFYNTSCN